MEKQVILPYKYNWRKVRDSNPRYHIMGIPDFESNAFGHSANLPFACAKQSIKNGKVMYNFD